MHKFIVTHQAGNSTFTNGFIIANHYDRSLATYMAMVAEARRSFPGINIIDHDAECCVVVNSGWCKRAAIVRFPLPTGTVAEGWRSVQGRIPDVVWD